MKFFLVKDYIVRLPGNRVKSKSKLKNQAEIVPGGYYYRNAEFIGKLSPFDDIGSENCKTLQDLVDNRFKSMSTDRKLSVDKVGLTAFSVGVSKATILRRNEKPALMGFISLKGIRHPHFLDILRDLSQEKVTLQVDLGLFGASRVPICKLTSEEMHVNANSKCIDPNVFFPLDFEKWHFPEYDAIVEFSIIVNFPDSGPFEQPITIYQQMLEGEVLSDVTLVAKNGTEIKAHKNILGVQSAVFLEAFQNDTVESRESKVELPEMEEETVRAFLKYLYYGDITTAQENFMLTLDLLKCP